MEAGGRAEVYAGTLTGATVSEANASLTLMTPQTRAGGSDLTLSLTGQVLVTEGGRLVSQRGADMSGAELTLSSQGGLILKGDTGCPEEGCSWTVKSLTTGSLSGDGNFYMHTNVAAGRGDRLVVTGTAEGSHRVYVADTGVCSGRANRTLFFQSFAQTAPECS